MAWEADGHSAAGREVYRQDACQLPTFFAPDINAAHKHLRDRGVKVGPIEGTAGETQWFSFWDLDQNLVEVCHY